MIAPRLLQVNAPARGVSVLLAYVVALVWPILFTRYGGGVACMWIATAVLGPYLAEMPVRRWLPALVPAAIASAVVTATIGLGAAAALPMAAINMAESAGLAWALRRRRNPDEGTLASVTQVATLVIAGALVSGIASAPGAFVASFTTATSFSDNVLNWAAGHALGIITFAPITMLVLRGDVGEWLRQSRRRELLEGGAILLAAGLTSGYCFSQADLPLLFLPILPVMIATFRIGRIGAALSIVMLAATAMTYTLAGQGPIAGVEATAAFRVQFLQFYLAAVVLTVLPAAADLRRRKEVLDKLALSEARYKLVSENAADVIMEMDAWGRIRYLSPSVESFGGGYRAEALVGTEAIALIHPDDADAVRQACIDALARPGETQVIEHRGLMRAAPGGRWLESRVRAIDGARELVCAIRDISARKAAEAELKHAAATDPLTGLANRRCFNEALDALTTSGKSGGCIAIFDIDHFKQINDRHGHDAGDRMIQHFAAVALAVTRATDLVARLGGEEFGILLPGATQAQAEAICDRLRREFAAGAVVMRGSRAIQATVSAGVARLAPGEDRMGVLRAADAALYEAKRRGRDCLVLAA